MNGSNFNQIAEEVLKKKRIMDELEAENRELRRQIADLRMGRGIFLEIGGQRFSLAGDIISQPLSFTTFVQEELPTPPAAQPEALPSVMDGMVAEIAPPARMVAEIAPSARMVAETPPSAMMMAGDVPPAEPTVAQKPAGPGFLEEIMLDEFATAATSPLAVWRGPAKKASPELTDEEQKAALRRDLMGSFLLE